MTEIIAIVVYPNYWLTKAFGPFDDLDVAREWAEKVLKQWYPLENFEWNDETTTYSATSNLMDRHTGPSYFKNHAMGIKIDVLEDPVNGK